MTDKQLARMSYQKRITFLLQVVSRMLNQQTKEEPGSERSLGLEKVMGDVLMTILAEADKRPLVT